MALHIAAALTYLHGLTPTVIHRDLKAKNVVLNADMEAKLSDIGIARERSMYDGSEHMMIGIGTSFWIASEVLRGHDYNERAAIYSFGIVLSEIDMDDSLASISRRARHNRIRSSVLWFVVPSVLHSRRLSACNLGTGCTLFPY